MHNIQTVFYTVEEKKKKHKKKHVGVSGQRVKLQVCETDICIITANLSVLFLTHM